MPDNTNVNNNSAVVVVGRTAPVLLVNKSLKSQFRLWSQVTSLLFLLKSRIKFSLKLPYLFLVFQDLKSLLASLLTLILMILTQQNGHQHQSSMQLHPILVLVPQWDGVLLTFRGIWGIARSTFR